MAAMRGGLALVFMTALMIQEPASGALTLELRVFNGPEEVTTQTRMTVHRAGDRGEPLLRSSTSADGRALFQVPAGIYDVQAIHEREGRVVNIRWANRLVVMPYPDEKGHHLEVINFRNGYGALQIRGKVPSRSDLALYEAGKRVKPAALPVNGQEYLLFIVPAGMYDLHSRAGGKTSWSTAIEVPLDRTRLWVIQQ
jgi:hypothetical protein